MQIRTTKQINNNITYHDLSGSCFVLIRCQIIPYNLFFSYLDHLIITVKVLFCDILMFDIICGNEISQIYFLKNISLQEGMKVANFEFHEKKWKTASLTKYQLESKHISFSTLVMPSKNAFLASVAGPSTV